MLGISASSKANLLSQLGAEANLLTVSAGSDLDGSPAPLPLTAEPMVARIPPVESVTAVGYVPDATVRRTSMVPVIDTGGISVLAAQPGLLGTLGGTVSHGTFLNAATQRYPAVVLGAVAARTLGIARVAPDTQVYLAGQYFTVIGILSPVPLAPEIDEAALVGFPVANRLLGLGGNPTELYLRALPDQVQAVTSVLPFTANPAQPEGVQVSTPSSILAARAAAGTALTGLFLGLGGIAAAVGAIGIANIMVISVLERRGEIGLRRALGAARWHVACAVPRRGAAAFRARRGHRGAARRGRDGRLRDHGGPARGASRGRRGGRARDRPRGGRPGRRVSRRQGGTAAPRGGPESLTGGRPPVPPEAA